MSTGLGIISGLGLLLGAIALGGSFRSFFDLEAVMITVGGTMAATLISFPLSRFFRLIALVLRLFKEESSHLFETTVARLVALAHKAAEQSVFSLEKEGKAEQDRYLRLGLKLLLQGATPPQISRRFAIELEGVKSRHQEGIHMFSFMSRAAPSFGLLGTVIGLINALRSVSGEISPETLGPSMALALVTTLYGCFLAFFLFLPASEKLKAYSAQEQTLIRMVREAMLMIKEGRGSRDIEDMLNAYLPTDRRQAVVERLMLAKSRSAAR